MQPDFSSTVVGVSSASMGAVTVGLALRLGTRILVDRKFVWEDGLVVVSWVSRPNPSHGDERRGNLVSCR